MANFEIAVHQPILKYINSSSTSTKIEWKKHILYSTKNKQQTSLHAAAIELIHFDLFYSILYIVQ